jgi:hypothetical protein
MGGVLNIGPLQWQITFPEGGVIRSSDPAYDGFLGKEVASGFQPLTVMPLTIRYEALPVPQREPLYAAGKTWAIWEEERSLIICSSYWGLPFARMYCRLNQDSVSAELFLDPAHAGADRSVFIDPLRYPLDQILSWGMLARCGGVILHSAVAVKEGVGWIFSGRSGAGKSTISELCHQAGWRILNDDRVMVFKRNGEWRVAGTPWHGSGHFSEADEVPLGGLFFIEKADHDEVAPMPEKTIPLRLLDVAAIPWFEDEWSQQALEVVNQLAHEVCMDCLRFQKDGNAVEMLARSINQRTVVPA